MLLSKIFLNNFGRLRSGWRVLVFVGVFIATFFLSVTVIRGVYLLLAQLQPGLRPGFFVENVVYRVMLAVAALLAGYICTRVLEQLPWRAMGLSFHASWFPQFLIGSVTGLVSLAIAVGIATAAGGLKFSVSTANLLPAVAKTLVFSAAIFVVAALAEEALFRGYPLQTLTRAGLAWVGLLLTSVPFALAHLNNPNAQMLSDINTGLAGVWLGVAYLRTRSLWFPLGVHWSWNWALGSLFGLPVSGITSLAPNPLLRGTDVGPAWITGGSYGIEGGIACTIAVVLSTLVIWFMPFVKPTEEMLQLTSHENPKRKSEVQSILDVPAEN
jgi:membrane protease YdiL (CAAX protease family)